jgi:hypothetical protein
MNKAFPLFLGIAVTLGIFTLSVQPSSAQEQEVYYCGELNGEPATMMRAGRQDIPITQWITTEFGEWTPYARCQKVSKEFQIAYEAGRDFLTIDVKNGYNIICATSAAGGSCEQQLMTIPPGEDVKISLETLENIQNGTTSAILLNTETIFSEYPSYDDGWNGEMRPYWNMRELRRQLEQ